eukprot:gene18382-biopygen17402
MGFLPEEHEDTFWFLVAPLTTIPMAVYTAAGITYGSYPHGEPDWKASVRNTGIWGSIAAGVWGWNAIFHPGKYAFTSGTSAYKIAGHIIAPAAVPLLLSSVAVAAAIGYVSTAEVHGGATGMLAVYMWEAEPRLYWRLKVNGKWTWKAALQDEEGRPLPPIPEVSERRMSHDVQDLLDLIKKLEERIIALERAESVIGPGLARARMREGAHTKPVLLSRALWRSAESHDLRKFNQHNWTSILRPILQLLVILVHTSIRRKSCRKPEHPGKTPQHPGKIPDYPANIPNRSRKDPGTSRKDPGKIPEHPGHFRIPPTSGNPKSQTSNTIGVKEGSRQVKEGSGQVKEGSGQVKDAPLLHLAAPLRARPARAGGGEQRGEGKDSQRAGHPRRWRNSVPPTPSQHAAEAVQ